MIWDCEHRTSTAKPKVVNKTLVIIKPDNVEIGISVQCNRLGEPLNAIWKNVYENPETYSSSMYFL